MLASGDARMQPKKAGNWDWVWLLAWGVVSSAWCMTAAVEVGATFDEPIDVANGLDFWRTGSHYKLMRLGSMPLPMDIASLPLHLWERWQGVSVNVSQGDATTALW